MNNWSGSGIFRHRLLSILAVSLVPLIILGLLPPVLHQNFAAYTPISGYRGSFAPPTGFGWFTGPLQREHG